MKFANRAAFLKTLNQWINDGSKILSFSSSPYGEEVVLKGKDGATEYLIFFFDSEDYASADYIEGDDSEQEIQPLPVSIVRPPSHFHEVLDQIVEEQIKYRQQYAEYLMGNPGFIATFGDDFIVEFGDMELSTDRTSDYNTLNEYRVRFRQEVRFHRNTSNDR